MEKVNAIGRRKAAVARVYLTEGSGNIVIDKRPIDVYFPSSILQYVVKQPLNPLDVAEKYDVVAHLDGALVKINPEDKSALRAEGFMTRDPRAVERKKPGQPKARKRFQFSKR